MWLTTTFGFFSIVQKSGTKHLTVRARVRSDLDRLRDRYLPTLTQTIEKAGSDYRYRATVSHADLAAATARIVGDIRYDNFKSEVESVQGHARESVYARVWGVLDSGLPPLNERELETRGPDRGHRERRRP
jgi:hypothetical protein